MFFILFLLILLALIITIGNSKLEIIIDNLDVSTERKEKIKKDFNIYVKIIVFDKVPIVKINLKKIKSKNISFGRVLEEAKKLQEKTNKSVLFRELITGLRNFDFEIKRADLKLELGTEDAALTAVSVGIIASVFGIILRNQRFEILPIYQNKNILKLKIDCIFRVNLIHYIYKTILKGRDKNEGKSSDRRAYAYSNE